MFPADRDVFTRAHSFLAPYIRTAKNVPLTTTVNKKIKRALGDHGDAQHVGLGDSISDLEPTKPRFKHLNVSEVMYTDCTHTSYAGGAYTIPTKLDNSLFLQHYASLVTVDWLHRFRPLSSAALVREVHRIRSSNYDSSVAELLGNINDLMPDMERDGLRSSTSTDFVGQLSLPSSRDSTVSSAAFSDSSASSASSMMYDCMIQDSNSMPPLLPSEYASRPRMNGRSSLQDSTSSLSGCSSPNMSSSFASSSRPILSGNPSYLSISETASKSCFKWFLDIDMLWASPDLSDEDVAFLSIISQVIQATARTFFPQVDDEQWKELGTMGVTRSDLRAVVTAATQYETIWTDAINKLDSIAGHVPKPYGMTRNASTSGTSNSSTSSDSSSSRTRRTMDSSSEGSSTGLTVSSVWDTQPMDAARLMSSSSSETSSNASSSSSRQQRVGTGDVSEMVDHILHDAAPASSSSEPNNEFGSSTLLLRNVLTNSRSLSGALNASSKGGSGGKRKSVMPDCAKSSSQHFIDSPAAVNAALRTKSHFDGHPTIYKIGMHVHFPNILVNSLQAQCMREFVVVNLVHHVVQRTDLLKNCRMLAFGRYLTKLSESSLPSTLRYWNDHVVDRGVHGNEQVQPHCRMIFSRRLSSCVHCHYGTARSKKQLFTGRSSTAVCSYCNGKDIDEGPDAVYTGMFAINGSGEVLSERFQKTMDRNSRVDASQTFAAVSKRPIRIEMTGGKELSIGKVLTPFVRWLPYNTGRAISLVHDWLTLTSIRFLPSLLNSDGSVSGDHCSPGWTIPSCWCHKIDHEVVEELNKNAAGRNRRDGAVEMHVKRGSSDDVRMASTSTSVSVRDFLSAPNKSLSPSGVTPSTSRYVSNHTGIEHQFNHASLGMSCKSDMAGVALKMPNLTSRPSSKLCLADHEVMGVLSELIRSAKPLWSGLWLQPAEFHSKCWALDINIPKHVAPNEIYSYYEGAERDAIVHTGAVWIVRCDGRGSHCCSIKDGTHKSSKIYFRITPTHIIQLCCSKSTAKCASKYRLIRPLPERLSKRLFSM